MDHLSSHASVSFRPSASLSICPCIGHLSVPGPPLHPLAPLKHLFLQSSNAGCEYKPHLTLSSSWDHGIPSSPMVLSPPIGLHFAPWIPEHRHGAPSSAPKSKELRGFQPSSQEGAPVSHCTRSSPPGSPLEHPALLLRLLASLCHSGVQAVGSPAQALWEQAEGS